MVIPERLCWSCC